MSKEIATLAGGCFWCVEAVFDELRGVEAVESGYMGGHTKNPTYNDICNGDTGHAEVVQITFDPAVVSFRELLEVFFTVHDPTTLNRQGNDVGTQYRSGIYHHNEEQAAVAREVLRQAQAELGGRVVTELMPLANYSRAEAYHQHYFAQHPSQGYCALVVAPKVQKFRQTFKARMKA